MTPETPRKPDDHDRSELLNGARPRADARLLSDLENSAPVKRPTVRSRGQSADPAATTPQTNEPSAPSGREPGSAAR